MERVYPARVARLRQELARARLDALLITHPPNLYYLSGFSGDAGALLVEPDRMTLFTDGRFTVQAREEVPDARLCISRSSALVAAGESMPRREGLRVGLEAARMSVAGSAALRKAAGKRIRWQPLEDTVEKLREVKDATELAVMRQAARLASEVFEEVLQLVKPGARELDLAAEVEYRLRRKGASGASFETIVASGVRAALPHACPTDKLLQKNELVVFDLGAILRHYCSDLTRTVYLGRAPARIRRWYGAVAQAQAAGREALGAGVAAGRVDAAARAVLNRRGLGRYFVHSTGHGLGLEIHETPRLGRGEKQRIRAGNVITVEPGVYVEGVGGIRIEDDVAVFTDHTEVLTTATREFLEL